MGFVDSSNPIWAVPPNWAQGVTEELVWGVDLVNASATAVSQHRGYRQLPRRSFGFQPLGYGQGRRVADALLAGHGSNWQLPIWPDVQSLGAVLPATSTEIPCVTTGFDFVAGGFALLYTGINSWERVEIDSVDVDHIDLVDPTVNSFAGGSRLYPLRNARLSAGSAEQQLVTDVVAQLNLTFDITEPCVWPELASLPTYLSHPVLEAEPDFSQSSQINYERLIQSVDYGTATPFEHDLPDVCLRTQQTHWKLFGRDRHTWFRSLLYLLGGRQTPVWLPSFASDFELVATIAGSSDEITVEWAGYTLFGEDKVGRADLRIELMDGSVFYRRITDSFDNGPTEIITLDSALDSASISPAFVKKISFMSLSTLASDGAEIQHVTDADGSATVTTGWQGVVPDV